MIQMQAIGNLGKDAEQKTIGGYSYASFSLAVTERIKGEDKTTWIRVMKIDNEGKLTAYLTKGTKVWVSGKPYFSAYVHNNTNEALADVTIWADKLEFCSTKNRRQNNDAGQNTGIDNFSSQPDDTFDDLPF